MSSRELKALLHMKYTSSGASSMVILWDVEFDDWFIGGILLWFVERDETSVDITFWGSSSMWWLVWRNTDLNSSDWLMAAQRSDVFQFGCVHFCGVCYRFSHLYRFLSRMGVSRRLLVRSRLIHSFRVGWHFLSYGLVISQLRSSEIFWWHLKGLEEKYLFNLSKI